MEVMAVSIPTDTAAATKAYSTAVAPDVSKNVTHFDIRGTPVFRKFVTFILSKGKSSLTRFRDAAARIDLRQSNGLMGTGTCAMQN